MGKIDNATVTYISINLTNNIVNIRVYINYKNNSPTIFYRLGNYGNS